MAKKKNKIKDETVDLPEDQKTPEDVPVVVGAEKKAPTREKKEQVSEPASTPKVVRQEAQKKRGWPWWMWLIVALVLIAGASVAGYLYWSAPSANDNTNTANTNQVVETKLARLIDGVMVSSGQENPQIYAVMVENSSDSRPPSGLDKASVVYEALAEGGITRFMALIPAGVSFSEVGPIRSARSYYLDWASEYKAMYVHIGGSPQALASLRSGKLNLYDLNQFYHSANFWRDKKRYAPHNVYSSSKLLDLAWSGAFKSPKSVKYDSWSFADDPALDARPETVKDIAINFSSYNYNVSYKYDRGQNLYKRSVGGQVHVTRDGKSLTTKNIVVQYTVTGLISGESNRLQMTTVGEGKCIVFRNGEAIVGKWKKASVNARTKYYDENGEEITLTRGNTWVEILPTGRSVTY